MTNVPGDLPDRAEALALMRERTEARRGRGGAPGNTTAVTHGITAGQPVIPALGETAEGWGEHVAGMRDALAPVGALEVELTNRVALLTWRLRRAARAELAVVAGQVVMLRLDMHGIGEDLARHARAVPYEGEARIGRYEVTQHRLLLATLHELEAIQRRREGDAPPLARVDVNVPSPAEG